MANKGLDKFVATGAANECWEFMGYRNKLGYGKVSFKGKPVSAHRLMWERHNNMQIPDEMVVMHSCDNRACCNPNHLSIGTRQENNVDAVVKGHRTGIGGARGESNPISKLTKTQVLTIRSSNLSPKEIKSIFNLSRSYSYEIGRYKNTWKHI